MNKSIKIIFVCALVLCGCTESKMVQEKPNILFILVDDLGRHDLACTGSNLYETPNIDKIESMSTVFTRGYATCAVCSPSRASLLTGRYPAVHGITDWIGAKSGVEWRSKKRYSKLLPAEYEHKLNSDYITLAEALQGSGYKTFFAGKWHLGGEGSAPENHGFQINIGGYHAGSPGAGGYFSPFNNPKLVDKIEEKGLNLSMKLAKETSEFIKANKDQHFLAYLSFYAVHSPLQTTQEKWSKYRNKIDSLGISKKGFEMERVLPIRTNQDNPVYAGLIEHVDDAIGEVLNTLKEQDLDKNTIIIFTSDNGGVASGDGYATNNSPLRGGKGYQWEGGIRVPYFIRLPGNTERRYCETPVTGADFYPTLLDLANIDSALFDSGIDGVSLVPILQGESIPERPLFWHYPHYGNQGGEPSSIVLQGNWKYIHYWEDGHKELYNLLKDESETENVIGKNIEVALKLERTLSDWLMKTEAKIPLLDSEYNADSAEVKASYYKDVLLPNREKRRQIELQVEWQPNAGWWGSKNSK